MKINLCWFCDRCNERELKPENVILDDEIVGIIHQNDPQALIDRLDELVCIHNTVNIYRNSTVEEGDIYEFKACGHAIAMNIFGVPDTLFCPYCGKEHSVDYSEYGGESRHITEFEYNK